MTDIPFGAPAAPAPAADAGPQAGPAAPPAAELPGGSAPLVVSTRGNVTENIFHGVAIVTGPGGDLRAAWGDPARIIFPRSSCKILQALPLVESGAADAAGLGPEQLALACASHTGRPEHATRVAAWLDALGLAEPDLRCGPQAPQDKGARKAMHACGHKPDQLCNNCSGKHAGFLTLSARLSGDAEYVEIDHPVQQAVAEAFHEVVGTGPAGWGVDGCSAPNHATTVAGLAHAMARIGAARDGEGGVRGAAMARLRAAMCAHPDLVEGPGRACSEMMKALPGQVMAKSGADGVFVLSLSDGTGVAVKIDAGDERAAACAAAAILAQVGGIAPDHPAVRPWLSQPIRNRRNLLVGEIRPAVTLFAR